MKKIVAGVLILGAAIAGLGMALALFPMMRNNVNATANVTNASEFYGFLQFNSLSLIIIFGAMIAMPLIAIWYLFKSRHK